MKRCFSLLLAAGVLAGPAMAQNLNTSSLAKKKAPETATWSAPSIPSVEFAFGGAPNLFGNLNYIGGTNPDGPGEVVIADNFPTISIEAEPTDLTPVAGFVQPGNADLHYFIATDDNLYSYTKGSGEYVLVGGPVTGFNFPGQEGIVGMQVNPMTGDIKVATLGCEADADGNYFQSFIYDFDPETFALSNGLELRDPAATGDEGDTGVCIISFSWDGADEIYGADIVLDDFVSVDATTGLLVERIEDPSDKEVLQVINFIQTAAYEEQTDTHYIFVLSVDGPSNGNIQALVYAAGPDDELEFAGFIDGNVPPNEILSGSFPYNNVVSAEGGPAGAMVAIGTMVPNPAADRARVPFTLQAASDVTLTVFDVLGRKVTTLAQGTYAAGSHDVSLDASSLAPGTYVVRLQAGDTVVTRTLSIAR